MERLNLEIIPQGTLNHILIQPSLRDQIVHAQAIDKGVKIIKQKLKQGEGKYKCFRPDDEGILWFQHRIVVPKNHELRKKILDEAHLSKFAIHPGSNKMYQDLKEKFW